MGGDVVTAVWAVLAVVGAIAVLLALGRYNETAIELDWTEVVTPAGRQAYEDLRQRFAEQRAALDLTCNRAEMSERAEEAAQLLAAGYTFLEHIVVERRKLLEGMARYSKMVGAIAPVPALRPDDFRLWQLATLAGVGAVVHHFLVTVPERLRIRILILRHGLGVVVRAFGLAKRAPVPDWQMMAAARADWNTVSAETLASFKALVTGVVITTDSTAPAAARR